MRLLNCIAGFATSIFVLTACSGGQRAFSPIEAPSQLRDSAEILPDLAYSRQIVVLKDGATDVQRDALAATLSIEPDVVFSAVFKGFAGEMHTVEILALQANPLVDFIEADSVVSIALHEWVVDDVPAFPVLPGEGVLYPRFDNFSRAASSTQVVDWGVKRIGADLSTSTGNGVVVAVLDTGCDMSHPDLFHAYIQEGRQLVSHNMIYPGRPADDGNGHGTHCAGIIGARDNSYGTRGVAPNCKIIPVKVLSDTGSGAGSWVIGGIDWCVANRTTYNIKVLSMSLGGGGAQAGVFGPSSAYINAINAATTQGMMVVAAAGNSYAPVNAGVDNNANGTWEPGNPLEQRLIFQPACIPNAICVSALDGNLSSGNWTMDCFALYSNSGSLLHIPTPITFGGTSAFAPFNSPGTFYLCNIDLIAPGTTVYSTYRNGRYAAASGTSMACPHAAGACALVLEFNPGLNRDQVLTVLQTIGTPGPAGGWPSRPAQNRPDPDGVGETLVYVGAL